MPIHDNLSKIGVANSKTLATFALVRWLCGHVEIIAPCHNGFVMFSAEIPTVPNQTTKKKHVKLLKMHPVPSLFTMMERRAKESTWYLCVSCFMFETTLGLGTGCGTDVKCKRAQGVLWFGTSYLPMCRTLQLELSIYSTQWVSIHLFNYHHYFACQGFCHPLKWSQHLFDRSCYPDLCFNHVDTQKPL